MGHVGVILETGCGRWQSVAVVKGDPGTKRKGI